jgi:hypothetical protein
MEFFNFGEIGSSADVGSSINKIEGLIANGKHNRCCCPQEFKADFLFVFNLIPKRHLFNSNNALFNFVLSVIPFTKTIGYILINSGNGFGFEKHP